MTSKTSIKDRNEILIQTQLFITPKLHKSLSKHHPSKLKLKSQNQKNKKT